jgi:hypothetical protein
MGIPFAADESLLLKDGNGVGCSWQRDTKSLCELGKMERAAGCQNHERQTLANRKR